MSANSDGLSDKERIVLSALADDGPQTPDEFVTRRGWYINSWAPTFTLLGQALLVERTQEMRDTSHNALAHVIAISDLGRVALANELVNAG